MAEKNRKYWRLSCLLTAMLTIAGVGAVLPSHRVVAAEQEAGVMPQQQDTESGQTDSERESALSRAGEQSAGRGEWDIRAAAKQSADEQNKALRDASGLQPAAGQSAEREIRIYLNGEEVFLTDPVQNRNGRYYLPFRSYFEILGASVYWDENDQSVRAVRDRVEAVFAMNAGRYTVNSVVYTMTDAALYLDTTLNRSYIPIRYGAESFGFTVEWVREDDGDVVYILRTPVSDGEMADDEIAIDGKIVWLGETEEQLISSIGYPARIDASAYGLRWYVYNQDYKNFIMVGMQDQKVKGFFSNSMHLRLKNNIGYGAERRTVEAAGFPRNSMRFWYDPHDGYKLYAVFCMTDFPGERERQAIFDQDQELLLRAYESECLDIANAFRLANGKAEVRYSEDVAAVARAYAEDMAVRDFLEHIDPDGLNPMERLDAKGIYVYQVTENLVGGTSDSFYAIKAWIESANHRSGILEDNKHTGVGAYYKADSTYRYYFTQEFITFTKPKD